MELPVELVVALDEMGGAYPRERLIKSAQKISSKYREEFGLGNGFRWDECDVVSYSVVRMPATFSAITTTLKSLKQVFETEITTVLDIGSGTGSAVWAVFSILENIKEMTCIEKDKNMMSCGKNLLKNTDYEDRVSWKHGDIENLKLTGKYDLVMASYSLNELPSATRLEVIKNLWEHTNKVLVIVEPGTPVAYKQMMKTRDFMLEQNANLIAPCPHASPCPLLENDWCHFTTRVARTKLHKTLKGGDAPFEDEKFSYLIFSKEHPSKQYERVLRHPLIESGKITLKLCGEDGVSTKIVTKKQKELFKTARKSDSGDLWKN